MDMPTSLRHTQPSVLQPPSVGLASRGSKEQGACAASGCPEQQDRSWRSRGSGFGWEPVRDMQVE